MVARMSRAYLRVDPAMFERKVIQQEYPPLAYAALAASLCLADSQPVRGRFRDDHLLRVLLGPLARQLPYLLEHSDIVPASSHRGCGNCPSGHGLPKQLYIDGWDEWQEGDWQVKERLARVRAKPSNGKHRIKIPDPTVSNDTDPTVSSYGSDRSVAAIAGRGVSVSEAGAARRIKKPDNVFLSWRVLTGSEADPKEHEWLEDLCHDFGRGHVIDLLYADLDPTKRGLLTRISRQLRKPAA